MKSIRKEGPWFKDEKGRTLLLRGVNLGGSSKVPFTPDGATHKREEFFNHREVSFIGRPFPLDEADEHFARLRSWGFTFLRLLTTWEAIEHPGPGQYDLGYLEYLRKIVEKAGGLWDYGLHRPASRCMEPIFGWGWCTGLVVRSRWAGHHQVQGHRRRHRASNAWGSIPADDLAHKRREVRRGDDVYAFLRGK